MDYATLSNEEGYTVFEFENYSTQCFKYFTF